MTASTAIGWLLAIIVLAVLVRICKAFEPCEESQKLIDIADGQWLKEIGFDSVGETWVYCVHGYGDTHALLILRDGYPITRRKVLAMIAEAEWTVSERAAE